jgi:hypothetical protein
MCVESSREHRSPWLTATRIRCQDAGRCRSHAAKVEYANASTNPIVDPGIGQELNEFEEYKNRWREMTQY